MGEKSNVDVCKFLKRHTMESFAVISEKDIYIYFVFNLHYFLSPEIEVCCICEIVSPYHGYSERE